VNADLIRQAFGMLADGHQGPERVRIWLEECGMKVSRPMLYKLFSNQAYIGRIQAFGKTYVATPPFLPLVTEDVFYRAGAAIKKRNAKVQWKRDTEEFPLRGTIRCECGALMTAQWSKGKTKTYPYYRCMRCANSNIAMAKVEDDFSTELGCFNVPPALWGRICESVLRQDNEDRKHQTALASTAQERVQSLIDLQKAIAVKNAKGVIPDDIARSQIEDMSKEIAELSSELPGEDLRVDKAALLEFSGEAVRDLRNLWRAAGIQKKKDLLRYIYPQGIQYSRKKGFQTRDYELLEQIKLELRTLVSTLVDPSVLVSNSLAAWYSGLAAILGNKSTKFEIPPNK
jgi:hypothetical protein